MIVNYTPYIVIKIKKKTYFYNILKFVVYLLLYKHLNQIIMLSLFSLEEKVQSPEELKNTIIRKMKDYKHLSHLTKKTIYDITVDTDSKTVNIFSVNPGIIIGERGKVIKRLAYYLREEVNPELKVSTKGTEIWV